MSTSNSKTRKVHWGLIGSGTIASKVASSLAGPPTSEVVAVAARDLGRAQEFARKFSIPRAYGSYDEMLASSDVDAVYVNTPNSLHHAHTLAALRAGKHVLCEKPMAPTVRQAEEMFAAARAAGRILMEAFMYRHHPLMREVVKRLRAGDVGEVRYVHSTFCFDIGDKPENVRLSKPLQGGAIMDIGCYCVNFARTAVGQEPDRIFATGHVGKYGVDEWTAATLGFPGGASATAVCAVQCAAPTIAQVFGSGGMIEIASPWMAGEPQVTFKYKKAGAKEAETVVVQAPNNRYYCQTETFNAAVLDGAPLIVTPEDTLGNTRVIEALHKIIGLKW